MYITLSTYWFILFTHIHIEYKSSTLIIQHIIFVSDNFADMLEIKLTVRNTFIPIDLKINKKKINKYIDHIIDFYSFFLFFPRLNYIS